MKTTEFTMFMFFFMFIYFYVISPWGGGTWAKKVIGICKVSFSTFESLYKGFEKHFSLFKGRLKWNIN